ncbi:uncharacterized protein (UPF0548 family) [Arthrobacter pigmenti]|uniref:Uncharacterized protein (UPF0548 family) n=1 Tax=Arthrobacter pigmenti TaxID=271432 RepID=A0A846RLT8_9MICC|nr:DUF1990 domain-containing protein [Arthrobacter pigmenti]NJC21087.1 uncharacterized protein (UPF0548 family) [Arthrobacter pigmenti]
MPEITHTAVGFTRTAVWPAGFRPFRHRIQVGSGEEAFRRLAEGILTFDLHRRAGLEVAGTARAAVGVVVVPRFGVGPLRLNAPCEVVWATDLHKNNDDDGTRSQARTARRSGFGYATLPGHPECGEEAFIAELAVDGTVYFDLRAYSRHGHWFYQLGAPVARFCQWWVTRRYLAAARSLARAG